MLQSACHTDLYCVYGDALSVQRLHWQYNHVMNAGPSMHKATSCDLERQLARSHTNTKLQGQTYIPTIAHEATPVRHVDASHRQPSP